MGKFDIYLLIVVTSSLFGRLVRSWGGKNMSLACAGVTYLPIGLLSCLAIKVIVDYQS